MIVEIVDLKRIAMAAMVTMGLGLLIFSHSDAGPPSCAAFNDPGAVFCDNFEDGDLEGWGHATLAGSLNLITIDSGLGGSNFAVKLFTPVEGVPDGSGVVLTGASYKMFVPNGGKFWIEWRGSYDSSFRWGVGCWANPDGSQYCNSSHKTFDLRNAEPAGNRVLMHVVDGGDGGSKGGIRWLWETAGVEHGPNVDPNFVLLPGKTYHFILEVTNAVGTAGRYKFWVDGGLVFDQSIQTCTNVAGCTWTSVALGGAQAGVGPGGNSQSFDDVRITRTAIVPWKSPDTTPPSAPKNPRVMQ